MKHNNHKMNKKLSDLFRQYIKKLPQKLKIIEKLIRDIVAEEQDHSYYEILYNEIHSLSGSSLTYGLKAIAATCRRLEKLFATLVAKNTTPSARQKQELMTVFYNLQKQTEDTTHSVIQPTSDGKMKSTRKKKGDTALKKKIILLVNPDNNITKELSLQLKFYGFEITTYGEISQINKAKIKNSDVIFILDASYLDASDTEYKSIRKLKQDDPLNVHIVFIAENDTFKKRLQAVRKGADAFFVLPLDITEMLDNLHNLTNEAGQELYHILIVDDDPEQIAWCALWLQQAGMITSVVSNPMQVIPQIIETKPELILMDMYMPNCNGMELAKIIRQQKAFVSIPIIFLSIENNIHKQYEALHLGGDDFLTKPIKPEHLIASVTIRANRYRKLRFYMERDSLTGLLNHSRSEEQLEIELKRAERLNAPLSYSMIDIDFFKQVNDNYGHLSGDRILKSLANLLQERLRRSDIIGRYGGEEFAVILPNTDVRNAFLVIDEIRNNFSQIKHRAGKKEFFVTISAGIAAFPQFPSFVALNEAADKALYFAKQHGRNKVTSA